MVSMRAPASTLLTAEQILDMPEARHAELVEGVLQPMTPAGGAHGLVAAKLAFLLYQHVLPRGGGVVFGAETGFVLRRNPDTVRGPDAAYVAAERLPPGGVRRGFFEGGPDLAAEVVSPRNTRAEVRRKTAEYLAAGTRVVWVVEPDERAVIVHDATGPRRLAEGDVLDGAPVLPEFRCDVAALFEGIARE
jgi:Uma2 family endonuclease